MVWHALLQSANAPLLALIATTMDRVVVWGALALVIGFIAWREYTLPEVSEAPPADPAMRGAAAPGSHAPPPTRPEAGRPHGRPGPSGPDGGTVG